MLLVFVHDGGQADVQYKDSRSGRRSVSGRHPQVGEVDENLSGFEAHHSRRSISMTPRRRARSMERKMSARHNGTTEPRFLSHPEVLQLSLRVSQRRRPCTLEATPGKFDASTARSAILVLGTLLLPRLCCGCYQRDSAFGGRNSRVNRGSYPAPSHRETKAICLP